MDTAVRKRVVISAVNLRKGGTLTVLRECLEFLSAQDGMEVTALVHDRKLCCYPGITYIELPWSAKSWGLRLWCEYVTMHHISSRMPEADLWLSLHDTSPRVDAKTKAVYCHTAFPFMKPKWKDLWLSPKVFLFCSLTGLAYKINAGGEDHLIVQQYWMRRKLSALTGVPERKIVVAPPSFSGMTFGDSSGQTPCPVFLYPSYPDSHKSFDTACRAAAILEGRLGKGRFKLVITVKGDENRYASWLKRRFGKVSSIDFHGFVSREELKELYAEASCLLFTSRTETWGLPISEFKPSGKPMILVDLPYARETAAGADKVAFFKTDDELAALMGAVLAGGDGIFSSVPEIPDAPLTARNWKELFDILMP